VLPTLDPESSIQVQYDHPLHGGVAEVVTVSLAEVRPALDWSPVAWSHAGFNPSDVDGAIDGSSAAAARRTVAEIFTRHFLARRKGVPENLRPEYETRSQHFRATDAALFDMVLKEVDVAHGAAVRAAGADHKSWVTEARVKLRTVWDRTSDPHMESLHWPQPRPPPRKNTTPKIPAFKGGRPANAPEPYEVPPDFDAAALQGVDTSTRSAALNSVPLAFLLRWLRLREEIPVEEREMYVKGQHLRGRDSDLCERCRAELMAVHGEALTALGLDSKWLVKEAKILIRTRVIITRVMGPTATAENGDNTNSGDENDAIGTPVAVGQKRKRRSVVAPEVLAAAAADSGEDDDSVSGDSSAEEFRGVDGSSSSSSGDVSVEHSGDGSGEGTNTQGDSAGQSPHSEEGSGAHKKRRKKTTVTARKAAAGSGRTCDAVVAKQQESIGVPSPQTGDGREGREAPQHQRQQRQQRDPGAPEEGSEGDMNPVEARKLQQRHAERQRRDMARRSQGTHGAADALQSVQELIKIRRRRTEQLGGSGPQRLASAARPTKPHPSQPHQPGLRGAPSVALPAALDKGGIVQPALAAVCAAWSPVFTAEASGGDNVFLAVGTLGGVLWLWQLQLPNSYTMSSSAPYPVLRLVALHQVTTVGSVTTLTYAQPPAASSTVDGVPPAVPLLAAGCSDGSVHLLSHGVTHSAVSHARSLTSNEDSPAGAPTAAAAAGQRVGGGNRRTHSDGGCPSVSSAQRSVEKLCVALVADLRAVTALHLAWAPSRAVGRPWRVQLLAGKHAGVVQQWSAAAGLDGTRLLVTGKESQVLLHSHGSATVTGVCAAGDRAISCGADGSEVCWSPASLVGEADGGGHVRTQPRHGTTLLNQSHVLPGSYATGVALSPGGAFAALARIVPLSVLRGMSQEQRIHAGAVELLSLPTSTTSTTTTTTTATSIAATASATAAATATAGRDGQSSRGGGKTCLSGGGGTDERAVAAVRLPWVQAAWKGGCHQVASAAALWECASVATGGLTRLRKPRPSEAWPPAPATPAQTGEGVWTPATTGEGQPARVSKATVEASAGEGHPTVTGNSAGGNPADEGQPTEAGCRSASDLTAAMDRTGDAAMEAGDGNPTDEGDPLKEGDKAEDNTAMVIAGPSLTVPPPRLDALPDLAPAAAAAEAAAVEERRRRFREAWGCLYRHLAAASGSGPSSREQCQTVAALRHMLADPQDPPSGGIAHEDLAALQQYIRATLSASSSTGTGVEDSTAKRMCRWVHGHREAPWMDAETLEVASNCTSSHEGNDGSGGGSGGGRGVHGGKGNDNGGGGAGMADLGGGAMDTDGSNTGQYTSLAVADPLLAQVSVAGSLIVTRPLCPATLVPLPSGLGAWRCGACQRQYAGAPLQGGSQALQGRRDTPRCVTCGVRLSRPAIAGVLPDVGL